MNKQRFSDRLINLNLPQREIDRKWRAYQNELRDSFHTGTIKEKSLVIRFKDTSLFKTSEVGLDTIYKLAEKPDSFINTTLLFSPNLGILSNYTDGFFPVTLIDTMEKLYNKLNNYSIDPNIFEVSFDLPENKIVVYSKVYYKDPVVFQSLYKDFMVNRFDIEYISGNQLDFRLVYAYLLQSIFINDVNINNNTRIEIADFSDYFNTLTLMFNEKLFENMQKIGSGSTYYISGSEIGETKILSGREEFLYMLGFIFTTHFKNYIKNTSVNVNQNEVKIVFKQNVNSAYFVENQVFSDSILYDYIFQNVIDFEFDL